MARERLAAARATDSTGTYSIRPAVIVVGVAVSAHTRENTGEMENEFPFRWNFNFSQFYSSPNGNNNTMNIITLIISIKGVA